MITFDITPGHQMILKTPGEYSMETAVAILRWLTRRDRCIIPDDGWRPASCGNLIEVGVEVQLDNIVFRVTCSYDDIFVERVAGNKDKFIALCEEMQSFDFAAGLRSDADEHGFRADR